MGNSAQQDISDHGDGYVIGEDQSERRWFLSHKRLRSHIEQKRPRVLPQAVPVQSQVQIPHDRLGRLRNTAQRVQLALYNDEIYQDRASARLL